jgi:hypothetical protein
MIGSLGNRDLLHSIDLKDLMQHLLGDGMIHIVHSDEKNTAGEHFHGGSTFPRTGGRQEKVWIFFLCLDFVGCDTRLSCPRDGSTTDSAGNSDPSGYLLGYL